MQSRYDVIVIGVGTMGAAACAELARRGKRVLGIERFDVPHGMGAHHGHSRMFRLAYFEHPDYVPLLRRALEGWNALNAASPLRPFTMTGGLYAGPAGCETVERSAEAAREHGIEHRLLTRGEAMREFPHFTLPDGYAGMYEPTVGFVVPEHAVAAMATLALERGAEIRARERVVSWEASDAGVVVRTDRAKYRAGSLVITSGAWTSRVVGDLGVPLRVTRQVLGWVWPEEPEAYALGRFPCWAIEDEAKSVFYGFPMLPSNPGLKVARHVPGREADPETLDRAGATREDEEDFREGIRRYLPRADGPTMAMAVCMYTNSPDSHFIIDRHPKHRNVAIACGFSGHGFKFAPVVGEILADLAIEGKTALPAEFLGLARFGAHRA